jgi:ADP-ribose pyrophosphatase YjhB (NUDIX family)
MRRAVRAIIINNDQLLVMHRNKFGHEYDTLPGGNIEIGETAEQALYREVSEETQVQFNNPRLVITEHAGDPYGDQYIYLCDYLSGEPQLHANSMELQLNKMGQNLYEPRWVKFSDLPTLPFLSEKLKATLLQFYPHNWPKDTVEITP